MSIKFSDMKKSVLRVLNQAVNEEAPAVSSLSFSPELLKDGIHAALRAITSRLWKRGLATIEAAAESFELPADFLGVDGLYENELGLILPEIDFQVGRALASTTGNGWFLYPTGTMTFLNKIGTKGARLYYQAHWTMPQQDGETLDIPDVAITALVYYAASHQLNPKVAGSADIRQFNTRVDSGQPGDIPALKVSNFFLLRYEEELKRIPQMRKGITQ